MVGAIAAAKTALTAGNAVLNFGQALSGLDFLKLFTSEVQNQNPMEPMDNSAMLSQIAQMANLQMVNNMGASISSLMDQTGLLQASGLIGKTVEFGDAAGNPVQSIVKEIVMNGSDGISLGLASGLSIKLGDIHRIM